ncbi:MAG TPA: glycoside hydrolase family 3 C-terminal domain-containing protein [Novosphingobium sp.]
MIAMSGSVSSKLGMALLLASIAVPAAHAAPPAADPSARAEATLKAMRPDEKTILTHGIMPLPLGDKSPPIPADAIPGAGYVPGIPRLGVPALKETDASLGVAYVFGLRKDGATALPSGLALAASWNPDLLERGGAMIGAETRAKGFNLLLAGGANLTRDPRNGRTFEYLSEDPLLTGRLVGRAIRGIQSNGVISTIKHFALNGQETGRKFVDARINDAAARESDLLAFQLGIEIGKPGSVMCAYNRVNGAQACASDYLLNRVLKQDWRYKGFVMSDWGAVPGLEAALSGLDQQSGAQLDPAEFFGDALAKAAAQDPRYAARLDDMNRRILWAIYAQGLDRNPAPPSGAVDLKADSAVALEAARQGIVLLRNERGVLPLARTARRIAVIGGHADAGVLSGAGSSQVHGEGGPALVVPGGAGPWAAFASQQYHRSSPLDAIRKLAPQADVRFRDGHYIRDAVVQARQADVAIVFATKWATEGFDQTDLTLPDGQDALIAAVAAANPNTIVVLETGNPVAMPWVDKTAAVIEAWYPGARGGEAIASILFGETNPSGRLPITFPATVEQLPRPVLDGFDTLEPSFIGEPPAPDARLTANYDIEGSDVGYRWYARKGLKPLFAFGHGLSYTTFAITGLEIRGLTASLTVANTGKRAGATVAQVYLTARGAQSRRRLVAFQRVGLAPGESRRISLPIDPRLLADWQGGAWTIAGGTYTFATGDSAEALGTPLPVRIGARRWKD